MIRTASKFLLLSLFVLSMSVVALAQDPSTNGHGALPSVKASNGKEAKRQFSFNARGNADGTATGHAVLHNPAFTGENGNTPYQLHVDVKCLKVVGNIAIVGGLTRRTNDPNLVDAVFFSVQDNGEPGKNDKISRAFFWDDNPATTGDPMACLLTGPNDFPLETIISGNIQVRQ